MQAFKDCTNLFIIHLSSNIESVEDEAFYNCPSVKQIFFTKSLVKRFDADEIFTQFFNAGLKTRQILLRQSD